MNIRHVHDAIRWVQSAHQTLLVAVQLLVCCRAAGKTELQACCMHNKPNLVMHCNCNATAAEALLHKRQQLHSTSYPQLKVCWLLDQLLIAVCFQESFSAVIQQK
jgi:hypothetical protein